MVTEVKPKPPAEKQMDLPALQLFLKALEFVGGPRQLIE